ncbi:response regulator transcription factor [Oceanobacillus profundus]|uniref:response regulator transcription factor n=1 Tax=Oceanobacillus profundus TaxID=372463 RepID=UPI000BA625A3|nr:response regulator transcription factor [Oceanobacillus profundus]MBR3121225.1 response regulator transcription factor [Oceanobacillus sp.]MCM3397175.1 response regulator transcription factor [Oceanobacillus profundus]PAE28698.1 DNA-binding response regulator [Paenibacillus sp. 7884-2]
MKQKIMVVEDDKLIRILILTYLKKYGYEVVAACDGEEAKVVYQEHLPCLIILDRMLPRVSGEEFCIWVREQKHHEVSIIMVSAKVRIADKIAGLRLGADAYLTKPFDPNELIAQIEAVLRRTEQFCQKIVCDGLCIMPRKGKVLLDGKDIKLTKYEFYLLYYFMQNPEVVLSREQLMKQIHPNMESGVMDRTIDAHIKKLREKIEAYPSKPKRIETVRGMGYKFVSFK